VRITVFHATDQARQVLQAGFVDGDGAEGLGEGGLVGVLLTATPERTTDKGVAVLAVTFPEGTSLEEYALSQGKHRALEWCVPAVVVNSKAQVRLLSDVDVSAILSRQTW
jgi:hypothetical protein